MPEQEIIDRFRQLDRAAQRRVHALISVAESHEAVDASGWPIGFFEKTYGSLADDPLDEIG
jgi:hypothetical protein